MKTLLLFIGLLQFVSVSAQQYGLVHNHLPAFYSFGIAQQTFVVDSSVEFSDYTVYYGFTTIRDTTITGGGDDCLDARGGDLMGRVLVQSDTKTSIINYQGDSVHYFRQTLPGESFVFYQYPNGMRIEASHFQSVYEEVLGTMDSVKYFRLQAFDLSGDSVDNDFNGEIFQLSQAHGLVSTFDNYLFPLLPYRYELSGFSNPVSGVYGIGWKAVFNIDIGDEFHIREQQDQWFYNEEDSTTYAISFITDKIRTVVATEIFLDSVRFVYQECWRKTVYRPDGIDTAYVSDTLIEEMVKRNSAISWQDLSWLDLYAGQFYSSNEQGYSGVRQIKTNSYNGRGQKYIRRSEIDGDSCLNYTIICPNWPEDYFVEGCGGPFYVYPGFGLENRRELRYFRKGGEQWGFPLADDCNDLISSTDAHALLDDGLLVYPNPFTRQLYVSSKTAMILVLRIFDVSGNLQSIEKVDGYHALLNTALLPAGLYLVEIQRSDGQIFRQKIIRK